MPPRQLRLDSEQRGALERSLRVAADAQIQPAMLADRVHNTERQLAGAQSRLAGFRTSIATSWTRRERFSRASARPKARRRPRIRLALPSSLRRPTNRAITFRAAQVRRRGT